MLCYISLGSNMGNTAENLDKAVTSILQNTAIKLFNKSSVYKTEPQGDKNQEWFANQVIAIEYSFDDTVNAGADKLMQYLLGVEAGMGRIRDESRRFGPRVIDIDIILFGNESIDTKMVQAPHPRVLERAFVLIPLQEIAPQCMIGEISVNNALKSLTYKVENNCIFQ